MRTGGEAGGKGHAGAKRWGQICGRTSVAEPRGAEKQREEGGESRKHEEKEKVEREKRQRDVRDDGGRRGCHRRGHAMA